MNIVSLMKKDNSITEQMNATYYYVVEENGSKIKNIKHWKRKGIYVNQSNPNQEIVVQNDGEEWTEAQRVPKCEYDESNGKATTDETMNYGDICLDEKRLVLIKEPINNGDSSNNENKKEYIAINSKEENENEIIYDFKMKEKEIIILNFDSICTTQVDGIVVLYDDTQLPVDSSTTDNNATAYRCHVPQER